MNLCEQNIELIIEQAAERAAGKVMRQLNSTGRIKYHLANSFKKTEELLYLYPKLPDGNPDKKRIERALDKLRDDEYYGVIPSRYFDGMTIAEISEIYDVKYQNISKKRNRLVKALASELFPEDVLYEIMQK